MPELRRDPVVERWTLIEVATSKPATQYHREKKALQNPDICPFCPTKEHLTPSEVAAVRLDNSQPNTPGWSVRTFPNKFPALADREYLNKEGLGIYDVMSGVGAHELIIETPPHQQQMADLNDSEMSLLMRHYQERFIHLAKDKRFKYVMLFKNKGLSAGSTMEHAHGQLIALPMVPKYVLEEIHGADHYYQINKRCVFCDIVAQEVQDKERIVVENEKFIAFCPFASRYAFETWILPKNHGHDFAKADQATLDQLGAILQRVLKQMKSTLGDCAYNFYLHTSPNNWGDLPYFHWHIEVIPKLTRSVGFEWGTGLHIVPTDPAMAARELRDNS